MSQSTTKPQNNAEIVKAYFDAFAQNDPTAIERYFTPDVDYVVIGSQLPTEVTEALPWLAPISQGLTPRSLSSSDSTVSPRGCLITASHPTTSYLIGKILRLD